MPQSKKSVEELFNEQPAYIKKLINFLVNEAYKQGYRDASKNDSSDNKLEGLKMDVIIVDEWLTEEDKNEKDNL